MATGWLILHIGALYARFGKQYPRKAWFKIHRFVEFVLFIDFRRALQIIGFFTTIIGFSFIIVVKLIEEETHFQVLVIFFDL